MDLLRDPSSTTRGKQPVWHYRGFGGCFECDMKPYVPGLGLPAAICAQLVRRLVTTRSRTSTTCGASSQKGERVILRSGTCAPNQRYAKRVVMPCVRELTTQAATAQNGGGPEKKEQKRGVGVYYTRSFCKAPTEK